MKPLQKDNRQSTRNREDKAVSNNAAIFKRNKGLSINVPPANTVEVKRVIAHAPSHRALLTG